MEFYTYLVCIILPLIQKSPLGLASHLEMAVWGAWIIQWKCKCLLFILILLQVWYHYFCGMISLLVLVFNIEYHYFAGMYTIWISDGCYSVHIMSFSDVDISADESNNDGSDGKLMQNSGFQKLYNFKSSIIPSVYGWHINLLLLFFFNFFYACQLKFLWTVCQNGWLFILFCVE